MLLWPSVAIAVTAASYVGRGGEALGVIRIILQIIISNKLIKKIWQGGTRVGVDGGLEGVVGAVKSIENGSNQLVFIKGFASGCKLRRDGESLNPRP
jgi:hypothetical protein